ncbi:hypothetical protein PaeCFBP13512_18485 [Paenibacillus sp. CFBP13512]|uniref:hypothetical protein n=1 Tax=Paenibacillus sp. CFBP13512 TaxID=2184007 RepID=UPI0010BFE35C|nr:hypothetical protein [Paenibacillus sp. CFBP13512]TKJ87211.1 hypothetical protein PaeCFBP13512_18485 [Paenibacillus sp. CFBP13512]
MINLDSNYFILFVAILLITLSSIVSAVFQFKRGAKMESAGTVLFCVSTDVTFLFYTLQFKLGMWIGASFILLSTWMLVLISFKQLKQKKITDIS